MSDVMAFRPDPRFFSTATPIPMEAALTLAGAEAVGPIAGHGDITHVAPFGRAGDGAVVYADSAKALPSAAAAPRLVLTTAKAAEAAQTLWPDAVCAVMATPRAGFAALARALHDSLFWDAMTATAGDTADIDPTVKLSPSATVMAGAQIGAGCIIGPGAVVGPGVQLGAGCRVGAGVTISHAVIGSGCTFAAGVQIGEAGFGYVPGPTGADPVPQLGRVMIGDRVDLGANTTVDRGALEDTVIGEGTKVDNLVQIAHNCRIGRHVLIASQTGVSGSCDIGDGVMIGGQAGMADHLTIGAGAVITAKSGLMRDVPPGEKWGGVPAKPAREWMKDVATLTRLSKKGER